MQGLVCSRWALWSWQVSNSSSLGLDLLVCAGGATRVSTPRLFGEVLYAKRCVCIQHRVTPCKRATMANNSTATVTVIKCDFHKRLTPMVSVLASWRTGRKQSRGSVPLVAARRGCSITLGALTLDQNPLDSLSWAGVNSYLYAQMHRA